jgi:hypothetical protein
MTLIGLHAAYELDVHQVGDQVFSQEKVLMSTMSTRTVHQFFFLSHLLLRASFDRILASKESQQARNRLKAGELS